LFDSAARRPPVPAAQIPRVIIQFWHDSADVPSDVSECLDSWAPLIECGFRRFLFDDDTARVFISKFLGSTHATAFDRCRHPAMRCDYFRLCWMLLRGGFYVDADEWYLGANCDELFVDGTLKVQPLCYDLSTETMVPAAVFLNEDEPSPEWIFYVNNNPLVAPRVHPVIRLALERATRLLLHPKPPTDIQSTTGPGNLTASLVRHSVDRGEAQPADFAFLAEWDSISVSRWPLSYRNDERNWRLWKPTD
jgi:mannosyltransferase OCH1-like enzyme